MQKKKDNKKLGPHLTQQLAQVDHWALYVGKQST